MSDDHYDNPSLALIAKVARIEATLEGLKEAVHEDLKRHTATIYGNGEPTGLTTRVTSLEGKINNVTEERKELASERKKNKRIVWGAFISAATVMVLEFFPKLFKFFSSI